MMFRLEIDCGTTSAFFDARDGSDAANDFRRRAEVARILQAAAVQVGVHARGVAEECPLYDLDGKPVGRLTFGEW